MRTLTIDERDFESPRQLMAFIKHEFALPEWFGSSLPAFNDFLGDICEPTAFTIIRRDPTPDTWFDKATLCIVRASLENDNLRVRVK